jgi:uncharacterized LabA/DUF88 family protein
MPTAVLIDGGFFLKRFSVCYPSRNPKDPSSVAKTAFELALSHLDDKDYNGKKRELYRIFFYDCAPMAKKAHQPVSRRAIDFSKTDQSIFRRKLHTRLRCQRKLALRLGMLSDHSSWGLRPTALKQVLAKERQFADLQDADFFYDVRQKGVDMRIGLDIASIVFKKQADQIVLVSGDSDFVPAAKLARREGIDFVLDPMWSTINEDLNEHVDGIRSTCPRPGSIASLDASIRS